MDPHSQPVIVLVDDNAAVREALAQLLEENDFTVLARVPGEGDEIGVCSQQPDLLLVDISMGDENGIDYIADMQKSGVPMVVCSSHEEPEYVRKALNAGARGYVSKRDAGQWLARTIRDVLDGWVMVSPRAADDLSNNI